MACPSSQTTLALAGASFAIAMAIGCSTTPTAPSPTAVTTGTTGAVIAGSVAGGQVSGLTVRVMGTNLSSAVGSTGTFEMSGVPAGTAHLQFMSSAINATADVTNVTNDQYVALQVQVNGSSVAIVGDTRSRKVSLCHAEDAGGYHLIDVSESAEAAHRAHGDAKIGEPVPGQPNKIFDASCRPVGPSVAIKKYTNDEDADTAPGPEIALGKTVQWRYVVTNDGSVDLTTVTVVDDRGVTVACPSTGTLAVGAALTCSGTGVVRDIGQYRNVGTVTALWTRAGSSGRVTASDPSHYLGVSPVQVTKFTNGEDADFAPGPSILVGDPVSWEYRVTNIGTVTLTGIAVVDDMGVVVRCAGQTTLAAGASMTCTGSGVATLGQYRNLGTVTATWTLGSVVRAVTDANASHYVGVTSLEGPKVTLCHRTGNGSYVMISVGAPAEPAHRAHGDGAPGEAVPGLPGKVFGPSCSVD